MDQLAQLGLELPSMAYIIEALLFGMVAWRHGRRTTPPAVTWGPAWA